MSQCTISRSIVVEGIGLHTGTHSKVELLPADAGIGIRFLDNDGNAVPVRPDMVHATQRGTTIIVGDKEIHTVEHLLSAIVGAGVHNVIISVKGSEIPILDGSSQLFLEKIRSVGLTSYEEENPIWKIKKTFALSDPETGASYVVEPADTFSYHVEVDFKGQEIQKQVATLKNLSDYEEVASARTFVFLNELLFLKKNNLIKGGSLDNAVVIPPAHMTESEIEEVRKNMDVGTEEVDRMLNWEKNLRFKNEPARHKLLDLIGDLAMLGIHCQGKITALKPGHKSNNLLAKELKKRYMAEKKEASIPTYNPDQEVVFQSEEIKGIIPHRYPFLLVDKIIELSDTHVVGIKNVTANENFFQGHFPGNPVFPGVLQMEALAQTGGILALTNVDDPQNWDTYFLKMDAVKFKNMVLPGDTLILKMELLSPIRRGLVHMKGTAYVGSKIASQGELLAQIVKRT